jgi:hypothetical protein
MYAYILNLVGNSGFEVERWGHINQSIGFTWLIEKLLKIDTKKKVLPVFGSEKSENWLIN